MWDTLSLTRGRVYRLQLLLALASAVTLGSESRGTCVYILLSQTRDSPNLESEVNVFISLRDKVTKLYPKALPFRLLRIAGPHTGFNY
jgi:hypothetical protein